MIGKMKNKSISYYIDLKEEEGMVIFGYFFDDYIKLVEEKELLIDRVIGFCRRNDKRIDYSILVNDYSQYELQIKVIENE